MTKPALARAIRIRRLLDRIDLRIRNLRFAESLAYQAAANAPEAGYVDTRVTAHMLAVRAIRAVESLQRRARLLARALVAALLASGTTTAYAADDWTYEQATKAAALATLTAADWAQTRNIARHPVRWHETNPLLGEHPSVAQVDRHFAASAIIGAAALHALPTRYRDWALNAGLVIEATCVANNLRLGIGVKF